MQRLIVLCLALAASLAVWFSAQASAGTPATPALREARAELAFLKQVNDWGPPSDPQLLFLLMGQYANAGRHLEGAAHLESLRQRFDARLDPTQKALYLTAIASLRAAGADQVFLLRRIGWVRDSLAMLDEADRLTAGRAWIVHWMSALVRARLPSFFGERDRAEAELRWCVDHADAFPHPGWLREVHAERARLLRERGDEAAARAEQAASGLEAGPRPVTFTTPFSEHPTEGHRFAAPQVRELVPGSVYLVSGLEFTEYYFVLTADRRELVAIDCGASSAPATARRTCWPTRPMSQSTGAPSCRSAAHVSCCGPHAGARPPTRCWSSCPTAARCSSATSRCPTSALRSPRKAAWMGCSRPSTRWRR